MYEYEFPGVTATLLYVVVVAGEGLPLGLDCPAPPEKVYPNPVVFAPYEPAEKRENPFMYPSPTVDTVLIINDELLGMVYVAVGVVFR